jgi:hypothetical protein
MAKRSVRDFDTDVCMGQHPDYNNPCPHRVPVDADTGHGVTDRLSQIEGAAMDAMGIGEDGDYTDFKCGMCACPLANLGLTNMAPTNCPRIQDHQ